MKYNYYKMGEILKEKRLKKGLSKKEVSRIIGISDTELSRIENGIRLVPNLLTLISLCEILSINFIELLVKTGFLNREKYKKDLLKTYKINIRKIQENNVEISARSEEEAIKNIESIIDNTNDFNKIFTDNMSSYYEINVLDNDNENLESLEESIEKASKLFIDEYIDLL